MDTLLCILNALHPEIDFSQESNLIDDGILDSFDIVTLLTDIEDAFGVTLRAEHLIPENFASAESLFTLIRRLMQQL